VVEMKNKTLLLDSGYFDTHEHMEKLYENIQRKGIQYYNKIIYKNLVDGKNWYLKRDMDLVEENYDVMVVDHFTMLAITELISVKMFDNAIQMLRRFDTLPRDIFLDILENKRR
jgi:hypothetical protein